MNDTPIPIPNSSQVSLVSPKMPGDSPLPYFAKFRSDGRLDYFLDSSMLGTFGSCEQKFKYRYIDGLVRKGRPFAMSIGSWWSHVTEHYYKLLAEGQLDESKFVEYAAHLWQEGKYDELQQTSPSSWKGFCGSVTKTGLGAAIIMTTEYYNQFAEYDKNHWQVVAAEAGFGLRGEAIVGENENFVLHWLGKPDLFVIEDGKWLKPVDHKTKDRIKANLQSQWKPHLQTAGYIVIGQQLCKQLGFNDVIVDRCTINIAGRCAPAEKPRDGIRKPRFLRVHPNYSQDELAEWRNTVMCLASRLHQCLLTDSWLWNTQACHLYAGCDYRGIDSVTPNSREVVRNANYVHIDPWIPYQLEDEEDDE